MLKYYSSETRISTSGILSGIWIILLWLGIRHRLLGKILARRLLFPFDTAEVKKLQPIGMQSLRAAVVKGLTLKEYWGYEDPSDWRRSRAMVDAPLRPLEGACKLIRPQVIGICFSIGDHKALDGVRDKV